MITFLDVNFHSCEGSTKSVYGPGINQDAVVIITRVEWSQLKVHSVHFLSLFLTTKYLDGHSGGRPNRFYLKIIGNSCSPGSLL